MKIGSSIGEPSFPRRRWALKLGVAASLAALGTVRAVESRSDVLRLGRVSAHPRRHYEKLDRLGAYLAKRLRGHGIVRHAVTIPNNNDDMVSLLRDGRIDLVSESPFSALQFEEEAGAQFLLREWKDGVASYRALFVTRDDAGMSELEDLSGRTIAFEDPGSTSSFFLPMLAMRDRGLEPIPLELPRAWASGKAVRYAFARSALNVLYWVANGRVDAGVVGELDWVAQRGVPEGLTNRLQVLHKTPPITRSFVMVRGGLENPLRQRIKEILVQMDQSDIGRETLRAYFGTRRFDAITGDAASDLSTARTLFAQLRDTSR